MSDSENTQALLAQWHALGEKMMMQALMDSPTGQTAESMSKRVGLNDAQAIGGSVLTADVAGALLGRLISKGFVKSLTVDSRSNASLCLMPTESGWLYLKGIQEIPVTDSTSVKEPTSWLPEPPAFLIRSSIKSEIRIDNSSDSKTVESLERGGPPDPFGDSQLPPLSIVQDGETNTSTLLAKSSRVTAQASATTGGGKKVYVAPTLSVNEMTLFMALKEVRSYWAKRQNVPPYCVCRTQSLYEMVLNHPTDEEGLRAVFGVGDGFMTHYAQAFLEVLTRHVLQPCQAAEQ